MRYLLAWITVLVTSITAVARSSTDRFNSDGRAEEYCELETFRPQCMKNEAIVMQTAIYGRRYHGRCLEAEEPDLAQNPRYLGCSADVIGHMDTKCSGKKQCEIRIPDADLQQARPCPKGVDMFLEVRYTCVEVVEEDRSCQVFVTSSAQHIARPSTSSSLGGQSSSGLHCGTKSQPWLLEAPAGQRINISILEFAPHEESTPNTFMPEYLDSREPSRGTQGSCATPSRQYGYVIDKSASAASKKNVSICSGMHRIANLYLSTSSTVEIVLTTPFRENHYENYLLRFEAIGCSDLIPPEDAWLKRTENEAIVGCYTSRQTWHLKCEDRRWIGVVSNCTSYEHSAAVEFSPVISSRPSEITDHEVLMIIAVGFVGLAVCLVVICCGIYWLRRYSIAAKTSEGFPTGTKYSYVRSDNYRGGDTTSRANGALNGSTQNHDQL